MPLYVEGFVLGLVLFRGAKAEGQGHIISAPAESKQPDIIASLTSSPSLPRQNDRVIFPG